MTVAERILSDIASIATVIALGVAVFQISVGNLQFDRSGPRFSWFDTGLVSYTTEATLPDGLSGTGEVQAIVVSNTGRTGDTIVGMGRAGDGDAMVLCTPEFDEDGNLMDRDAVSVGGGTVALCVCSIESGPCERVDVFHVSGRFWSTSACGEKRTPARPAWTSFPS